MMKCRPRPQLIAFQFACKWFRARAGPISWRVNQGRGWKATLIYRPGTRYCTLPWVTTAAAGSTTNPQKKKKTYQHFPHLWTGSIFKKVHVISFIVEKWHRTDQRVNLDRKLVLLVLRHWALMTWQRRRQIGLMLESCGLVKLDYNALKININIKSQCPDSGHSVPYIVIPLNSMANNYIN